MKKSLKIFLMSIITIIAILLLTFAVLMIIPAVKSLKHPYKQCEFNLEISSPGEEICTTCYESCKCFGKVGVLTRIPPIYHCGFLEFCKEINETTCTPII